MIPATEPMSDAENIVHFLRNVEWRLRANRLLQEITLSLSRVLMFLIVIKIWDLVSPFKATTIMFVMAASVFLFAGYVVWLLRNKGTLDQAAVSIDERAGLSDEIKTALWFIRNPRSSKWVDRQIQGAARSASQIDVRREYPTIIPRTSYAAFALILVLLGLNFLPLPLNHNWLSLRAAPEITLAKTAGRAAEQTPSKTASRIDNLRDTSKRTLDLESILAGLEEIAAHLQDSETLRGVAQALMDKRLDLAAEELRKLGTVLDREPTGSFAEMQETLNEAAQNSRPELQALSDDLAATARAMKSKNMTGAQEALEETAEEFEGLEEEIYKQESTLDQLARGNERHTQEDGHVSGAPIPEARDLPQKTGSGEGLGVSENKSESGLHQGTPTRLAAKLQQEAMEGMRSPGVSRVDVEQASRQERSKLDYRGATSKGKAAQKDVLDHREGTPWKYRSLIKSYFEAILEPASK